MEIDTEFEKGDHIMRAKIFAGVVSSLLIPSYFIEGCRVEPRGHGMSS
jgi:hypothetical protein